MAKRTVPFTKWLKLITEAGLGDGFEHLGGKPVVDVAKHLGISHARIYQLIEEGSLDVVAVTVGNRVAVSMVTDASLERYLAERTPDRNRQGYFAFAK